MLRNTFLALCTIAATLSAQCGNQNPPPPSCSTLSITGNGAPGTTLTFDLQGPALRFAFTLIADHAGPTTVAVPGVQVELGVQTIWYVQPMGITGLLGNASATINLPAALTPASYFAQGIVLDFTPIQTPAGPAVTVCTSNVEPFSVGTQS